MPGATLPGNHTATFGKTIARVERIERNTQPLGVDPAAEMVFSYPGALANNVESPPWYVPRSGRGSDQCVDRRLRHDRNGVRDRHEHVGRGATPMTTSSSLTPSGWHVGTIGMGDNATVYVQSGTLAAFHNSDYGVYLFHSVSQPDVLYAALYKVVSNPAAPTGYSIQFTGSVVELGTTSLFDNFPFTFALNDHVIVSSQQVPGTSVAAVGVTVAAARYDVAHRCLIRSGDTLTLGPLTAQATVLEVYDANDFNHVRIDETRFVRMYGTEPSTTIAGAFAAAGALQIDICTVNGDGTVAIGNSQYDATGLAVSGTGLTGMYQGVGSASCAQINRAEFTQNGYLYGLGVDGALGIQQVWRYAIPFDPTGSVICPGGSGAYKSSVTTPVAGPHLQDRSYAGDVSGEGNCILSNFGQGGAFGFFQQSDDGGSFSFSNTPTFDYFPAQSNGPAMPHLVDEYVMVYGQRIGVTSNYEIRYRRITQSGTAVTVVTETATALNSTSISTPSRPVLAAQSYARHANNKIAVLVNASTGFGNARYTPQAFPI
jgi:hypothetical protein